MQPTTRSTVAAAAMTFLAAASGASYPLMAASPAYADSARIEQLQKDIAATRAERAASKARTEASKARTEAEQARGAAADEAGKCAVEISKVCPGMLPKITLATACKVRRDPSACNSG
ncbi:hypothetical protein [Methylosinus sp. Sm6]|uniref:hypothetical protein n=1 Tax=Methylosinus sp. Sm6 TaxID=2866948 RepID=UPI001C99EDCD|nr:hypothetical protein [Methylosinus sp. Sm6]MBY6240044.1 hypothetical protein [Methylosinus sp. Sm6]